MSSQAARTDPGNSSITDSGNETKFSSRRFVRRLVVGAVLLNLIILAFAAVSLYHSYQVSESGAVVATQNLAQVLERDLAATFAKMDLGVLAVKDEAERQYRSGRVDAQAFNAYIATQASRQPDLYSLRVANANGDIAYGTGIAQQAGVNLADRSFFRRLRDDPTAGFVVSEPVVGQISGKWSIALARRIDNPDGSFAGVVFAAILLEGLQKKFATLDLGSYGVVSLRDLDLGTVVRYPEPKELGTATGNRTHSKEWPEKIKINPMFGSYFAVGLDGLNRALSFRRIQDYPFYVIVGLYAGDYNAEWRQDVLSTTVLVVVFMLTTILFSWLIRNAWKRREIDSHRLLQLSRHALHESEQHLRLALDSAAMGTWVMTPGADTLNASVQAKALLGLPPAAPVTREALMAAVHEQDRPVVAALFSAKAQDQEPLNIELRVVHADGNVRWMSWCGRAFPHERDGTGTIIGVVQDITDRRTSEQLLLDASRRKDEFLATLAHELRNPLAPVRNGLQIMRLSSNRRVREEAREMIERQVRQMVHLLNDLFDISRITEGRLQLRKERINLRSAIDNAVETSLPLIEEFGHELYVVQPPTDMFVEADAIRLAQVISNLLNNSARYTPKSGQISLTVAQENDNAVISVKDNGIGIPADVLPHVFDMFTQAHPGMERSKSGLGIGLALVKRLVELHGGAVSARSSEEGGGAEFVVRLPLATAVTKLEPRIAAMAAHRATAPTRRILIVDDNPDNVSTLDTLLRLMRQETAMAHDGREALEVGRRFLPAMIFLDIGMPGLDGYEVARRIRAEPWGKHVVLIALTGWGQEQDRRRARDAGFNHHMVKPADLAEVERLLVSVA